MYVSKINLILKSKLSQYDVTLDDKQTGAVREAMIEYAINTVDAYRTNEVKATAIEQVSLIPSIFNGNLKLWFRKWNFKRAKRIANNRAKIENRKMYCIRTTDIQYMVASTLQVDYVKRKLGLSKSLDFRKLSELSDYIAFPPKNR